MDDIMDAWIIWIVVACVLGVGEILTTSFFLAPFSLGAVAAAIADALGASTIVSWIAFIVVSIVLLTFVRPVARRHVHLPPQLRTGGAALVGSQAVVLERISNREGVGTVRIGGDVWTARAYDEDRVIEPGAQVDVIEIRGATALVSE